MSDKATAHEHYWIDAPEDEALWFCPACGRKECRHGVEASDLCDECESEIDADEPGGSER